MGGLGCGGLMVMRWWPGAWAVGLGCGRWQRGRSISQRAPGRGAGFAGSLRTTSPSRTPLDPPAAALADGVARMDAAGHTDGALFRAVGKADAGGNPLDSGDVPQVFRAMAAAAGWSPPSAGTAPGRSGAGLSAAWGGAAVRYAGRRLDHGRQGGALHHQAGRAARRRWPSSRNGIRAAFRRKVGSRR